VRPKLLKLAWSAGLLALAAGCGSTGGGESTAASPVSVVQPEAEPSAAMTALPSRSIAFDHFALEGAVNSELSDADGVDGDVSTTWALHGDGVELRMEVSSWFSQVEAEVACQSSAGDGAEPSLAWGTPSWTTEESVYVTQRASCVRVTVLRGRERDGTAAAAVAGLLATPEQG
jgi:hypothetical protein